MSKAYILNIETSDTDCTVSLSREAQLLDLKRTPDKWQHSSQITVLIQALLEDNDLTADHISAVAVSMGPGSFTGLRVGMSAAKALSYTWNIPLLGIPTLRIIAEEFRKDHAQYDYFIASIDARRDEIYFQVYDNTFQQLNDADNLILTPESFSSYKNALFCGNAADKAHKIIDASSKITFEQSRASAQYMPALAEERFSEKKFEDVAYFSPFYLKPPNITSSKKPLF